MKLLMASVFLASAVYFISGCSDDGGTTLVANTSTISSASLASARGFKAEGNRVAIDCTAAASTSASAESPFACTPINLDGRVFFVGALVGQDNTNGGANNKVMTFFADSDAVIQNPGASSVEGTKTFDLSTPALVSGNIGIPEAADYPAVPVIWRFESAFDYVDAEFSLDGAGGVLDVGTHIIRLVFRTTAEADDVDDTMQIGDKLLFDAVTSKFLFCDATDCTNTTRPTSGNLQQANVIAAHTALTTENLPGNPNYAGYAIDIPEADQITPALDIVSDTTRLWTVDFDVTSAINFTAPIAGLTTTQELVSAFKLGIGVTCNDCTGDTGKIGGKLTIGDAGSATTREWFDISKLLGFGSPLASN